MKRLLPTAKLPVVTLLFALIAVSGSACGGTTGATPEPPVSTADAKAGVVAAFSAGGTSNYEPARGPFDLSVKSDLVVAGSFAGFQKGPIFGRSADAPDAFSTVIGEFDVDRVVRGTLPDNSEGTVYLLEFGSDPALFEDLIPKDAPALLFLQLLPPEELTPGAPVQDADTGRPPGQPTFASTTPQGVLFEIGDSVIQPSEGTEYPNQELERFESKQLTFPEGIPVDLGEVIAN